MRLGKAGERYNWAWTMAFILAALALAILLWKAFPKLIATFKVVFSL